MANIGSLIKKEFGRLKTDKRTLVLIFVIPIILIVIFGLTSGGGPTQFFTVAVISEDELTASGFTNQTNEYDELFIDVVMNNCSQAMDLDSWYNSSLENTTLDKTYYDPDLHLYRTNEINKSIQLIQDDIIDAVIILPANFSECVENQTDPWIIYIGDGTDLNVIDGFSTALSLPIAMFKIRSNTFENFSISMVNLDNDVPSWKPQVLNYAAAMILPIVILGTTMNLTSLCIVTETPLPRLVLTPSGKKDFIISKLIAYSLVMVVQVTEIFGVVNLFGLYCRGPLLNFYAGLILIGFTGICMGMAVSAICNTSQQANQMFISLFIMVTLFSGSFIELARMRPILGIIAKAFPLTWALPLLRDIQLRGLAYNLESILILFLIDVVYMAVAYVSFAVKKVEV